MALLLTYGDELATAADLFHTHKAHPIVPKNAAHHSGAIKWVRGLKERIEAPLEKVRGLSRAVLETEEAKAIFAQRDALVEEMQAFEGEHVKEWVGKVSTVRPRQRRQFAHLHFCYFLHGHLIQLLSSCEIRMPQPGQFSCACTTQGLQASLSMAHYMMPVLRPCIFYLLSC